MLKSDVIKALPRSGEKGGRTTPIGTRGASIFHLPKFADSRGNLTVGEFGKDFPFNPKRYFIVFGVPPEISRGEHAHKTCHQFLICAKGMCTVLVDDGTVRREILLDQANIGIYLPPMIWSTQRNYSADAALLVFASEHYDPDDYIHQYSAFQAALTPSS